MSREPLCSKKYCSVIGRDNRYVQGIPLYDWSRRKLWPTFAGWYLYPSRQMQQLNPVSSFSSSICLRTDVFTVTWPFSLVVIPSAPNCFCRMAMASRFFSLFVWSRISSIWYTEYKRQLRANFTQYFSFFYRMISQVIFLAHRVLNNGKMSLRHLLNQSAELANGLTENILKWSLQDLKQDAFM